MLLLLLLAAAAAYRQTIWLCNVYNKTIEAVLAQAVGLDHRYYSSPDYGSASDVCKALSLSIYLSLYLSVCVSSS
jgi:hypothetical protein